MIDFLQPTSLDEAVNMLQEYENVKILAGGTDLIVRMRAKAITCDYLLDGKKIPELNVLQVGEKGLEIGAAVHANRALHSGLLVDEYDILHQAMSHLANSMLRNRATMVGNICNASPLGDTLTSTLVLDGYLEVASTRGTRNILLKDFYHGPGKTDLKPDEIVVKIVLPHKKGTGIYKKKQRIKGHDLAQVGVAAFYDDNNKLSMAFGAVGPIPILVDDFGTFTKEELAVNKAVIVDKAANSITPISDVRCSKEYRMAMTRYFTELIIDELSGKEEVSA